MRIDSIIRRSESDPRALPMLAEGLVDDLDRIRPISDRRSTVQREMGSRFVFPLFERRVCRIYRADLSHILPGTPAATDGFEFRLLRREDERQIHELENLGNWPEGTLKARVAG